MQEKLVNENASASGQNGLKDILGLLTIAEYLVGILKEEYNFDRGLEETLGVAKKLLTQFIATQSTSL